MIRNVLTNWRGARFLFTTLAVFAVSFIGYIASGWVELGKFWLSEGACRSCSTGDITGVLGGMKIKIPRDCAELVEYDGDPGLGERPSNAASNRNTRNIRSLGMDVRLPEMSCKSSKELKDDYRSNFLNKHSLWLSIGVNSGEIYPGPQAAQRQLDAVLSSIRSPNEFWLDNYERTPEMIYGLDAFVVSGTDPQLGGPAKDNERASDKFFGHNESDAADLYISCGKTYVPRGVATCVMKFSMEPSAKAMLSVRFSREHLSQWREIKNAVVSFVSGLKPEN